MNNLDDFLISNPTLCSLIDEFFVIGVNKSEQAKSLKQNFIFLFIFFLFDNRFFQA